MEAKAKAKCPECGFEQLIVVPKQGVLPFYLCKGCKRIIPTPKGAHCVLCAYSDYTCK